MNAWAICAKHSRFMIQHEPNTKIKRLRSKTAHGGVAISTLMFYRVNRLLRLEWCAKYLPAKADTTSLRGTSLKSPDLRENVSDANASLNKILARWKLSDTSTLALDSCFYVFICVFIVARYCWPFLLSYLYLHLKRSQLGSRLASGYKKSSVTGLAVARIAINPQSAVGCATKCVMFLQTFWVVRCSSG